MVKPGMKTDLRGGLSLLVFFIENAVENLFKFLLVGEQHMKFFPVLGVVAPRHPHFQITLRTVLLVEVFDSSLIVPGSVELGIICQTVLNGFSYYRIRLDEAVGLRYNHSVAVARLLLIGCPVVFNGTTHSHNLFAGEVRLYKLVRFEYCAGVLVMVFPAVDKTEVMKRRYDVNHIGIHSRIMFGEFYALFNYHADMALLMRLVECGITGDYLILNIVYDLLRYRLQFQFRYFATLPLFFQYLTTVGTLLGHTLLAYMASVTFAREFLIGEILTALPAIMSHGLFQIISYNAFHE